MKVTVYSLPDCPKCEKLKDFLKGSDVDFEARWFDTEAQTDFIMMNMFGNPPILTVGDNARVEPSENLFDGEKLKQDIVLEALNG
jgi:glutaredoxin